MIDSQQRNHIAAICEKYPPLSQKAEEDLFKAYNAGDMRAANKLVLHHTRLAYKTAMTFAKFGAGVDDCFSAACLGIAKALPKYDPSRGARFVTAARLFAVDEVVTLLEQSAAAVKIPSHIKLRTMWWTIRKIDELYGMDEIERHPAAQALVKKAGLSEEALRKTAAIISAPLSLDNHETSGPNGEKTPYLDQIAGTPAAQEANLLDGEAKRAVARAIQTVLATKSDRHREMFVQRHLVEKPATISELAEQFQVTPMAVRKMNATILSKIRGELDKAEISEPGLDVHVQLGGWQAPAPSFG
jgi:RNA polymerase sigma-32 factor